MASPPQVVAQPIPAALRAQLIEDAGGYAFTAPDPRAGGAFAMASLTEVNSAPRRFAEWLSTTPEWAGLRHFAPNEASYQRYARDGNGLPPHRDQRYYVHAIAIVTLEGEATFALHRSADRFAVIEEWRTTPGQVVLLPGWDPDASTDPRPYHRVDAPSTPHRLMLQLRQNVAADRGAPLSHLTSNEMSQALELTSLPPAERMT